MTTWIRREPVRFIMGVQGTVSLLINGLVVFEAWDPTAEQLAFLNGAVVSLGTVWGFTSTRAAVAVRSNVLDLAKAIGGANYETSPAWALAKQLWPDAV